MIKLYLFPITFVLGLLIPTSAYCQDGDSTNDLIKKMAVLIDDHYVIQENSSKIIDELFKLSNSGKYDNLEGQTLARTLTLDIKRISQDQHFRVHFSAERVNAYKEKSTEGLESRLADDWKAIDSVNNYGFSETGLLDGNIGYIKIDEFTNPEYSEETFVNCLNELKSIDGLIFDLNDCIGGSGSMVWLIISYFFEKKPATHLVTYNCPSENVDLNIMTKKKIQGTRFPNIPIYILVSSSTYSSGESFCYTLKHLDRATIVGDTTKGGAHSWKEFPLNDTMSIQIPNCQFINPITETDWEGKGVIPDIIATREESKIVAHIELIKLLQSRAESNLKDYEGILTRLKKELRINN